MKYFLEGLEKFKTVTLSSIRYLSRDTKYFTFSFDGTYLGLPIGQHITLKSWISSEAVTRLYTPTTRIDEKGKFGIPIKIYSRTNEFPEGGLMTQHLDSLEIGSTVEVSGPRGYLTYEGEQTFKIRGETLKVKNLGFVTGGTGITPCFQLIQYIIENNHNVNISLVYANKTLDDILLKEQLDSYKDRVKLFYVLNHPPADWKQGNGLISKETLINELPKPSEDTLICHCGSKAMNALFRGLLEEIGHKRTFKF